MKLWNRLGEANRTLKTAPHFAPAFDSCFWASSETSTRQLIFYGSPRFGLPALELCFATADDLLFLERQRIIRRFDLFWFAGFHMRQSGWCMISSMRYVSPTILK